MFKWLAALLVFLFPIVSGNNADYVGDVAAEAAYSAMLTSAAPSKPKVPTKDCTTCNGTGRVRTGDANHPWTKCPECEGVPATPTGDALKDVLSDPAVKIPKSDPTRYSPPPAATRLVR